MRRFNTEVVVGLFLILGLITFAFLAVSLGVVLSTFGRMRGFAILMLSAFAVNKVLGILTAITLLCALAADFLLLPAILLLIDKDKKSQPETKDVDDTNPSDAFQPAR